MSEPNVTTVTSDDSVVLTITPGTEDLSQGFWCGFTIAICTQGLFQDLVGREGYMELVRDHWVNSWISGPIEVVGLILAFVLYAFTRGKLLRKTSMAVKFTAKRESEKAPVTATASEDLPETAKKDEGEE